MNCVNDFTNYENCTDGQKYLDATGYCNKKCDNYHVTTSDKYSCVPKSCPSSQIIKKDGTCETCPEDHAPDSHTQRICVHESSTSPVTLSQYQPLFTNLTDFFPSTKQTQMTF